MVRCLFRYRVAIAVWAVALSLWPVVAHGQSTLDGFNPGANGEIRAFAVQADGKILVAGAFTTIGGGGTGSTTRRYLARLNIDGSVDSTFNPDPNGTVFALALQPNGQILAGGDFTTFAAGAVNRSKIARLNSNGSVDGAFDPGANNTVFTLAVQDDGKILAGGDFTQLGGGGTGSTTRNHLARINSNGTLDTFNPGANARVWTLVLQPDGQILAGGYFTMLGGGGTGSTPRSGVGRLSAAGVVDAGFNPSANSAVYALAVQADGRILLGGDFTGVGPTSRSHIARVTAGGALDTGFNPGANGAVRSLLVQPDGSTVVGGQFSMLGGGLGTTPRNRIGRLHIDGSVDGAFDPGADVDIVALGVQSDGKLLVGGYFTMLGGGTGTTARSHLGRLYPDGTLEINFSAAVANVFHTGDAAVASTALQPDGQVVIGGSFDVVNANPTIGPARENIARVHVDGSRDAFNPGTQSSGSVATLAVSPDGKIVVGGSFNTLGNNGTTPRQRIGRVNADGSLDPTFDPGANGLVRALAIQADGKILVGGDFTMLGGGGSGTTARNHIGRLNADGSLDTSFDPGANSVCGFAVQPDGKILVGGATSLAGGSTGRLNPDGSRDSSFQASLGCPLALQRDGKIIDVVSKTVRRLNPDGSNDSSFTPAVAAGGNRGDVSSLGVQADGRILVAGGFATLNGTARSCLGRLNADGSLDSYQRDCDGFPTDRFYYAAHVQGDGKVLISNQQNYGGDLYKLTNSDPAIQRLSVTNDGTITWARSGASPEVERVIFESSTDGANYTVAGSGVPVPGGWQLTGQLLPSNQNFFVRARGYYQTGMWNASGSIVESVRNGYITCVAIAPSSLPAAVIGSPYSVTFTTTGAIGAVTFSAIGTLPTGITFSGDTLSGTPTQVGSFPITITATDAGAGCTGSATVTLVVAGHPPAITTPPQSHTIASGESRTLTVAASGTAPFTYQWYLGASGDTTTPIGGATAISYTTPAVTSTTSYWVRVTNPYGSADSATATLTVSALAFTDDPLVAGTPIKVIHLTELRNRIGALRARYGLSAFSYTHPSLTAGVSIITSVDVLELRAALQQVYSLIGATPPSYSTSPAVGGTIRVADIAEIRAALRSIE